MEGLPGSKFPKYRHCLDGEGGSDPYQPNLGNACILYSLADSRDASASKNFMMLNVGPTLLVVEELFHSAFQVLTGGCL